MLQIFQHVTIVDGPHKGSRGVVTGLWTDLKKKQKAYVRLDSETTVEVPRCQISKTKTPDWHAFFGPPKPLTWIDELYVSERVVEKYLRRSNASVPKKPVDSIRNLLRSSKEIQLKPRFRPIALMNHRLEEAKYYHNSGWLIVIAGDRVRTIYRMKNQHRFEM